MTQRLGLDWSRRAVLGAVAGAPFVGSAFAQAYPSRNPRMIVPFAAGGPTDVLARVMAEKVSPSLGQQVIVESRPGAGGNLAADLFARAEANGYTLLVAGQAILAINKALYKKLSYDPAADFIFIGMLGVIANVLLVNPQAVPVNSLAELIALAKKKPGEISYGSNGPGSLTHLTTAILAQQAGMDLLHVPYQGAAPLMTVILPPPSTPPSQNSFIRSPSISGAWVERRASHTSSESSVGPSTSTWNSRPTSLRFLAREILRCKLIKWRLRL